MFVRTYQQAVATALQLAIPVFLLSVCAGISSAGESFYYSDMDGDTSASCQSCSSGSLGACGCSSGGCESGGCSGAGLGIAGCGAAGCGAASCGAAGCGGGCGPLSSLLAGRCGLGGCGLRGCCGAGCGLGGGCALCSGLLCQSGPPSDGSHCGLPAPKYPVPFATPRPTTPTHLMYPPMSPHNSLPHYRSTYQFRHGPGLSRTQVHWRSKKLLNLADYIHHIFEIPR